MKVSVALIALATVLVPVFAAPEPLLAGNAGDLETRTCKKIGVHCRLNEQCCTRNCRVGKEGHSKCRHKDDKEGTEVAARDELEAVQLDARTCKKDGDHCRLNEECCSRTCKVGKDGKGKCDKKHHKDDKDGKDADVATRDEVEEEQLEARTCKKDGDHCRLNEQCCSRTCKVGKDGKGKCDKKH